MTLQQRTASGLARFRRPRENARERGREHVGTPGTSSPTCARCQVLTARRNLSSTVTNSIADPNIQNARRPICRGYQYHPSKLERSTAPCVALRGEGRGTAQPSRHRALPGYCLRCVHRSVLASALTPGDGSTSQMFPIRIRSARRRISRPDGCIGMRYCGPPTAVRRPAPWLRAERLVPRQLRCRARLHTSVVIVPNVVAIQRALRPASEDRAIRPAVRHPSSGTGHSRSSRETRLRTHPSHWACKE